MKTIVKKVNQAEIKLEILTIEEAVKKQRLTREDATHYHTWHKNAVSFVDNKHLVYTNDDYGVVCQGVTDNFPTEKELDDIAIKWFIA